MRDFPPTHPDRMEGGKRFLNKDRLRAQEAESAV